MSFSIPKLCYLPQTARFVDNGSNVAVVDARYEQGDRSVAFLTPSPPDFTGRAACDYAISFWIRSMLVTLLRMEQRIVAYLFKWSDKKHRADKEHGTHNFSSFLYSFR